MHFFRLPLNLKLKNIPNLESLANFKGYYGIEFIYRNKELQLLLLLNDKYLSNSTKIIDQNDLFIYLDSIGILKDDVNYSEYVNYDILNNLSFNIKQTYSIYLDFTNASIIQFLNNSNINKFYFKRNLNISNNPPNFLEVILKYLIEINHDFIWQLFFTSKRKNKFYIGSQLSLFIYSKLVNAFSKSIKNNLNNLFSDFYIKLKRPKFPFKKNSILINSIKEHYPYQWYNKPIFIINNYFTLPRATNYLTKLIWEYNTKLDTKNSDTEVRGIPIGYEVVQGLKNPPIVNLSLDDMTSHFSCFGITSQGKSRLMYSMLSLIEKTDKHFLVVDTKGEYLEALSNNLQTIIFYKVGSLEFPLHLNIFLVPPGINRDNHEYFLYSLLSGIMGDDISPQMNRILFKSIKFTVENKGNFQDFLNAIDDPRSLNIKGSYLELSGSGIINRLLPLITGPGKSCFLSKNSNINFFDLINKNVIIDLSQFELIESTIARKVFVNTFLHYFLHSIRFNNAKIRDKGDITNFILIEEIQKIAPIIYQGKNQVNSFIGLAPWTVRAYGVCLGFIGTDIDVETPILTNTGISMFFYSKTNIDKIAKLLGIQFKEYSEYLKDLKERKRFLLSIKGDIKLVESFEFEIPKGEVDKNKILKLNNILS